MFSTCIIELVKSDEITGKARPRMMNFVCVFLDRFTVLKYHTIHNTSAATANAEDQMFSTVAPTGCTGS